MQHIPLPSAYLCQDCNSVGNCASQCPACASGVLMCLASVLNREEEVLRKQARPAQVIDFYASKQARSYTTEILRTFEEKWRVMA